MLVFWKQRLVFLAVPKTGTSAYAKVLTPIASASIQDPPELKHAPVYRYNRFIRPMYEKVCDAHMETIAVMREPFSWLGSWYRYRRRPFMKGRPNSTHDVTYNEFVLAYMKGKKPDFANVGSQQKFLETQPNGVGVDHLFKYENQARLIDFLQDRLEIQIDLPRENVSPALDLDLSSDVETRFRRKFTDEFEMWEGID